jgi:hypothetical protein
MGPEMARFITFLFVVVLTSCSPNREAKKETMPELLPVQVQREWRLHDATMQPLESAPESIRKLGAKAWLLAHYQANGTVTVRMAQLPAGTAFEAMQRWHDPSALGFFKDDYFGTVESDRLTREELAGFVQDLQQNIKTRSK